MNAAQAFESWWLERSRKGDPSSYPNLTRDAFAAGFAAGQRQAERDARADATASATEARWQERQGEDYGSY